METQALCLLSQATLTEAKDQNTTLCELAMWMWCGGKKEMTNTHHREAKKRLLGE